MPADDIWLHSGVNAVQDILCTVAAIRIGAIHSGSTVTPAPLFPHRIGSDRICSTGTVDCNTVHKYMVTTQLHGCHMSNQQLNLSCIPCDVSVFGPR